MRWTEHKAQAPSRRTMTSGSNWSRYQVRLTRANNDLIRLVNVLSDFCYRSRSHMKHVMVANLTGGAGSMDPCCGVEP